MYVIVKEHCWFGKGFFVGHFENRPTFVAKKSGAVPFDTIQSAQATLGIINRFFAQQLIQDEYTAPATIERIA